MSVRKRKWTTSKGVEKEAWVVDYVDGQGVRRLKTFDKKKEADAFKNRAGVEVEDGTHVAASASKKISAAGDLWLASAKQAGLERGTLLQYRHHLELHIKPFLGERKLSELTVPLLRSFQDQMLSGNDELPTDDRRREPRSASMVKKVLVSLGSLVGDAQERGLVARNVVRDLRAGRKKGKERRQERRQKGKLKVGVDIPSPAEVKAIVGALKGPWRPLLLTAILTGLRASELRGLRWMDVDLQKGEINVRQRADYFNEIGPPKSEAGERTVPMPPLLVTTLKEWKLAYPRPITGQDAKGKLIREAAKDTHYVFPNGRGNIESRSNIVKRGLKPAQIAAGVTVETAVANTDGKPILEAKYTGMHALRHFYASWCINREVDGGQGLPPKVVQERLGHSSIVMTMDTYGHLFARGDDANQLAAAEAALLA